MKSTETARVSPRPAERGEGRPKARGRGAAAQGNPPMTDDPGDLDPAHRPTIRRIWVFATAAWLIFALWETFHGGWKPLISLILQCPRVIDQLPLAGGDCGPDSPASAPGVARWEIGVQGSVALREQSTCN